MSETLKAIPFVGRSYELAQLNRLLRKKTASIATLTGRRRVGKSRLIAEFVNKQSHFWFQGLAPDKKTTAQHQRDHFASQLHAQGFPKVKADDWNDLLLLLAEKVVKQGRIILVFDEISWMGDKDPTFLSKLQSMWEQHFKKNHELILVICGSVSTWIEENILSSTGYFGRVSLRIHLEELPLSNCIQLLEKLGFKRSGLESFMILSVTGGIPFYLEQIDPAYGATENIKQLCFEDNALLVNEFKYIFHDLFGRRGDVFQKIVALLAKGPQESKLIAKQLHYARSGVLSSYLSELETAGFIDRDYTWLLHNGQESKLSKYRLRDNYLRFYLKYIDPNRNKIKRNYYKNIVIDTLPQWESIIGLQFENLVLSNRGLIQQALNINPQDIVADNPFFQKTTVKQKGCQIDYLIHTRYKTLFICEIKFTKNHLTTNIIKEVEEKINRLSLPRGYAVLPVLIYAGELSGKLEESDYFHQCINFIDFIKGAFQET